MGHHDLFEIGGAHISRLENVRLITGASKYASDWNLPNQLHAYFLRSDRVHADAAELIEIDYEELPVIIGPEAALAAGAPLLHDSVPALCRSNTKPETRLPSRRIARCFGERRARRRTAARHSASRHAAEAAKLWSDPRCAPKIVACAAFEQRESYI